MNIKDRRTQMIGAAVVIIIIVLLVVFVPGSGGGGTPIATPTPTETPGPTLTGGPTSTPGPTATYTGEGCMIFFTEADYQLSGEGEEFYTTINITPVELFFGAQFGLEWDCTLFEMETGWTQSDGGGQLYNGTSPNPGWTRATQVAVNLDGDNSQCPDPTQGLAWFVVDWGNYYGLIERGEGVNMSKEGTLLTVKWHTHSGADFRSGTTGIGFVQKMKAIGYLDGPWEYDEHGIELLWSNTSVTVN